MLVAVVMCDFQLLFALGATALGWGKHTGKWVCALDANKLHAAVSCRAELCRPLLLPPEDTSHQRPTNKEGGYRLAYHPATAWLPLATLATIGNQAVAAPHYL